MNTTYLLYPNEAFVCTWLQITKLLLSFNAVLKSRYPKYAWYIADCDGFSQKNKFPDGWPYFAEDISRDISYVEQFMSWVFFLAPSDVEIDTSKITTEAKMGIQCADAIIEIRAFDTSYIEVDTRAKEIDLMPLFEDFTVKMPGR